MTMSELRRRLTKWGDFTRKRMDYADELGENILYAAQMMCGRGDVPGHKVLTYEVPKKLQEIDRAVSKLEKAQKCAIRAWYCAPVKEDGGLYSKREISTKLGTSHWSFERDLASGERAILLLLTA